MLGTVQLWCIFLDLGSLILGEKRRGEKGKKGTGETEKMS